jgi:hypothetical protein
MDQRLLQLQYRIEHEHSDGGWGEMVEDRSHHDAADHDPERGWSLRRIFRCTTCDEVVTLSPGGELAPPDAE